MITIQESTNPLLIIIYHHVYESLCLLVLKWLPSKFLWSALHQKPWLVYELEYMGEVLGIYYIYQTCATEFSIYSCIQKYLHFLLIAFKFYEKSRESRVLKAYWQFVGKEVPANNAPPAGSLQARGLSSPARRDPKHFHLGCGMLGTLWAGASDLWRHCAAP